jgi:hypothetical protein
VKEPNYFLYYVSKNADKKGLTPGEAGIGRTSLSPGVHDARWGTMMVVSYDYVWNGHHGIYGDMDDPKVVERIILSYFRSG